MKPLSEHLLALIMTAEEIMRAPSERRTPLPSGFAEVASAIRRAHQQPAEGVRATYAGIVMLDAIEAFSATINDRWQMQIGALLPILRDDAWQALRNEKGQREPEAYRR